MICTWKYPYLYLSTLRLVWLFTRITQVTENFNFDPNTKVRNPSDPHFFLHFINIPIRSISENIALTTLIIRNILKYKAHVENNELNETSTGQLAGSHLCMNQYRSMFRKYRRAEKNSDIQIQRNSVYQFIYFIKYPYYSH